MNMLSDCIEAIMHCIRTPPENPFNPGVTQQQKVDKVAEGVIKNKEHQYYPAQKPRNLREVKDE